MKYNLVLFTALFCVLLPLSAQAGDFVGLVGIPGIEPTGDTDLNVYINALYRLSISLAALLAVIKIVAAGAKYMLSDIVPAKEEAKKDIQGALIGLLIVIGAIIILNTVNSDLTELDLSIATTTITQGPTIQEVIALQQVSLDERAAATQSTRMTYTCAGALRTQLDIQPEETNEQACRRICRETLRGIYNYNYINPSTSDYNDSEGQRCNPNQSAVCCVTLKDGSWDSTSRSCSGLTEGRAARRLECGREGRVWDEAGDYCRTASCNVNTNANCCAATNGTIQNGVCLPVNPIDAEVNCANGNGTWTEPNGPLIRPTTNG